MAAVFYSFPNFLEAVCRLIGNGVFILMIFVAIKYSNSVRIYSYCKLITTLGFIIKTAIDGYYSNGNHIVYADGSFYGVLCPMWFGYLLFFIEPTCGE